MKKHPESREGQLHLKLEEIAKEPNLQMLYMLHRNYQDDIAMKQAEIEELKKHIAQFGSLINACEVRIVELELNNPDISRCHACFGMGKTGGLFPETCRECGGSGRYNPNI